MTGKITITRTDLLAVRREDERSERGMKIVRIIPIHERDGCKCEFCGATKSVKYILDDGRMCCNKCALIAFGDREVSDDA